MSESRERFLAQLERCVKHQPDGISAPDTGIYAPPESYNMGEHIAVEDMGNAAYVECDAGGLWGLRPPGEEPPATAYYGDWG